MNKRAPTYFGEELLRRTQEAAFKEWNANAKLPRWDRDEQMVFGVVRWRRLGPLYYLKPKAESAPGNFSAFWPEFERWAAKQNRRSLALHEDKNEVVADFCNRLLAELKGPWLRRAVETLEGIRLDSDARSVKLAEEKRLEAVVAIVKAVPQIPREDVWRRDVLLGLRELLGREPTAREAGLASILCGAEVVTSNSRVPMKVSKAIEKEVHTMRALLPRKKAK